MIAIIAEKPSVAREIASIVGATKKEDGYMSGNGYNVTWAFGHLITLAMPEAYGFVGWKRENLPMLPDKFKTIPVQKKEEKGGYVNDPGVEKQLKVIGNVFKECEKIIVATDAGREGELIFRYIYYYLNCKKPFERLWISSLTDKAIKEGLKNVRLGSNYDDLFYAARERSESDWLVGMNASQALAISASRGVFSLGRVQTPTLAMICKRYLENKNFVPVPYWQIKIQTEKDNVTFSAITPARYEKKEDAESIYNKILSDKQAIVQTVDKKQVNQQAPLLYDLTSLQQEANKKLSLTADTTLSIAQKLYEAKLITYPRTGSRYISDDVLDEIPGLISFLKDHPLFGDYAKKLEGKPLNKKCVNASKVTDHHALLPTGNKFSSISGDERQVYDMIVARMLEAFSGECIKDVTTIMLFAGNTAFEAKGYVIKQSGWRDVKNEADESGDEQGDKLPNVSQGDKLPVIETELMSKQTKPKPLFTEASLLGAMESAGKEIESEEEREAMKDSGLGTPATRAGIIETLVGRKYIVREKKSLIPSEKGLQVYEVVKEKQIANVSMTGKWEFALSKIEKGELAPALFKEKIRDYTIQITSELLANEIKIDSEDTASDACSCPKCGKKTFVTLKLVAKCTSEGCGLIVFREIAKKVLTDNQISQLIKNKKTPLIKGFKSKAGKSFDAALKFDDNYKVVFEFPERKK